MEPGYGPLECETSYWPTLSLNRLFIGNNNAFLLVTIDLAI